MPRSAMSGGNPDHRLLGDAGVDEALGELLAKLDHGAGRRDVGDQRAQARVGLASSYSTSAKALRSPPCLRTMRSPLRQRSAARISAASSRFEVG